MYQTGLISSLSYALRNLLWPVLFRELRSGPRGAVLDIGGGAFAKAAAEAGVVFDSWATLEPAGAPLGAAKIPGHQWLKGRGERIPSVDNCFDTVTCIQVLEHVPEPGAVLAEVSRVLRPGGKFFLLVPQNTSLHMLPQHYFGFTRSWLEWVGPQFGFQVDGIHPLGGFWRGQAYRYAHYLLQECGYPGKTTGNYTRPVGKALLLPLQLAVAAALIPLCLVLSLCDLRDEAPNHLAIYVKNGA